MNPLERLAEERTREAIRAGCFDRLPGMGEPLPLEDLSGVPEELRASYLLLKGAGVLPEEMQLAKERLRLDDLIAACEDAEEARDLGARRRAVALRYAILMEARRARDRAARDGRHR